MLEWQAYSNLANILNNPTDLFNLLVCFIPASWLSLKLVLYIHFCFSNNTLAITEYHISPARKRPTLDYHSMHWYILGISNHHMQLGLTRVKVKKTLPERCSRKYSVLHFTGRLFASTQTAVCNQEKWFRFETAKLPTNHNFSSLNSLASLQMLGFGLCSWSSAETSLGKAGTVPCLPRGTGSRFHTRPTAEGYRWSRAQNEDRFQPYRGE